MKLDIDFALKLLNKAHDEWIRNPFRKTDKFYMYIKIYDYLDYDQLMEYKELKLKEEKNVKINRGILIKDPILIKHEKKTIKKHSKIIDDEKKIKNKKKRREIKENLKTQNRFEILSIEETYQEMNNSYDDVIFDMEVHSGKDLKSEIDDFEQIVKEHVKMMKKLREYERKELNCFIDNNEDEETIIINIDDPIEMYALPNLPNIKIEVKNTLNINICNNSVDLCEFHVKEIKCANGRSDLKITINLVVKEYETYDSDVEDDSDYDDESDIEDPQVIISSDGKYHYVNDEKTVLYHDINLMNTIHGWNKDRTADDMIKVLVDINNSFVIPYIYPSDRDENTKYENENIDKNNDFSLDDES
jgi:hypothetical protein